MMRGTKRYAVSSALLYKIDIKENTVAFILL